MTEKRNDIRDLKHFVQKSDDDISVVLVMPIQHHPIFIFLYGKIRYVRSWGGNQCTILYSVGQGMSEVYLTSRVVVVEDFLEYVLTLSLIHI